MKESDCSVLLLTSSSLKGNGVGSLFINDLINLTPNREFIVNEIPAFLMSGGKRLSFLQKCKNFVFVRFEFIQYIRLRVFLCFMLSRFVDKIESNYANSSCSLIWLVASTPELIFIGKALVDKGYDVRVTVWDDPEYLARNLKLPHVLISELLISFKCLLEKSSKGMVISHAMKKKYEDKYAFSSEVIRHGIDVINYHSKVVTDTINVVFAGSLYSKKEWNCFVDAMSSVDWNIGGKKVEIYYIGDFPLSGALKPKNINFLGRKTFSDTMSALSNMHIGYLPYWFSDDYKIAAATSFPGKMSAYACAGLAVFHHGPIYTEVTHFLSVYNFGVCCNSLDNEKIVNKMLEIISKLDSQEYRDSRLLAVNRELSSKANTDKIDRFLML